MPVTEISSYLNFDGNAADVIARYEDVFDCEAEVMRFRDMEGHPFGEEANDLVMHAALPLGKGVSLMLCDLPPGRELVVGRNAHVVLTFDDRAEMEARFAKLAEGGEIEMALHDAFWGTRFGMVTDAFGTRWMFNAPQE